MAGQDQLEIIRTNGVIEFYDLDPTRGITNIGSHPENDIVLDSPGVAPFHAMLDHRFKPYQLVVLSHEGQTRVSGQPVAANASRSLQGWDNIEIDGQTLILVETGGAATSPGQAVIPANGGFAPATTRSAPPPSRPVGVSPPTTRPEPIRPGGGPAATALVAGTWTAFKSRPPDQEDDHLVTELSVRDVTIDVEQTATFQLTIINGGDIVAAFYVNVQGVDPAWVEISQPMVNLNEGARATVVINISPPRRPTSRAGAHHLAFIVTSPNYPGRSNQRGATLTLNPYYEFAVGEISPRQQSLSWFKRSGFAFLPIVNRSNTPAQFQIDGSDDERSLSFEFQVPGEAVNLARQAELHLQSSENVTIPVEITPHSRPLIGLRRRPHPFTLSTMMLGGQQAPRSVLGQLAQSPLLGPLHLLLLALLLAFIVVLIFRPYIKTFNVDGSASKVITAGQSVTLNWNASPFARLVIPELGPAPLENPQGKVTAVPTANVTYELRADNWLSRLSPNLFGVDPRVVSVILTPVPPDIQIFDSDKKDILSGQSVDLSWLVNNADKVVLVNQSTGNAKPLPDTSGSLDTGPLDRETTYVLLASNPYIATPVQSDPFTIRVSTPTPTPLPTPVIVKFFANPPVIVAGDSTTLEWQVDGTDRVNILGIGAGLPAVQTISQSPQQTTNYVLDAANGPAAAKPQSVTVFVTPAPTATPVPDAPEIVFFTADPTELIQGQATPEDDEKQVKLSWLINGTVTNVELNGGPDVGIFSNLDHPEGSFTASLTKNAVFVLTAFNQDKTSSKTVQVQVLEATPTTTPEPTKTPLPTATATPVPAEITDFKIIQPGSPQVNKINPNLYQVQKNTEVTFQWQTNSAATKVILTESGGAAEVGSVPVGQVVRTITENKNYTLVAQNSVGNESTPWTIQVQLISQPPPDPPYDVAGDEQADKNVITWKWKAGAGQSDIIGFRVYRADAPDGTFEVVPGADETVLQKGSPKKFEDSVTPTCDKVYYVVAVYEDIDGLPQESAASKNSWYSSACP